MKFKSILLAFLFIALGAGTLFAEVSAFGRSKKSSAEDAESSEVEKLFPHTKENSVPAKINSVPVENAVPADTSEFLVGRIYDLKRSPKHEILCGPYANDRALRRKYMYDTFNILNKNFTKGGGSWNLQNLDKKFYRWNGEKLFSRIFMENLPADDFMRKYMPQDPKYGIPTTGILFVLTGEFAVPETGNWRFVGLADDLMLVAIGERENSMQTVFCAFYPQDGHGKGLVNSHSSKPTKAPSQPMNLKKSLEFCCETDGKNISRNYPIFYGPWFSLKKGVRYKIVIAFGETGDNSKNKNCCKLGLQNKAIDSDGNFPLFTVTQIKNPPPGVGISKTGHFNISCSFSPSNPQRFFVEKPAGTQNPPPTVPAKKVIVEEAW